MGKNDPTLPVRCLIGHDSVYLYLREEDGHNTCHCNIKILIFTDHGKTNYYKKDIWNLCWILTKSFKHHRNISNTKQYSTRKLNLQRLCNKRTYNEKLTIPLCRQASDKVVVFIWRYILKFDFWFVKSNFRLYSY